MSVTFNAGANFAEGKAILSPIIQEIINTTDAQVGLSDQTANLGFVVGIALTPEGTIESTVGPEPLRKKNEDGLAAKATKMTGWTKGYGLEEWALQYSCTKLLSKWIEAGAQIQGADSSVKTEIQKFKNNMEDLIAGSNMTKNILMTKVFAQGFAATSTGAAFGPGSLLGDGQLLFSASHVVKKTGATFSNLIGGAFSAAQLETEIQAYKTLHYAPNGYRIRTPDMFTLYVPRALETAARKVLNSSGDQAGIYAGTANNANLLNVFSFAGSKVKMVVLDLLGEVDEDGAVIGGTNANTMWFLGDADYNREFKSFRMFTLWDKEIKMWVDNDTDRINTKIDLCIGADSYNFEGLRGYVGA